MYDYIATPYKLNNIYKLVSWTVPRMLVDSMKLVTLEPPQINHRTIIQKIECVRPMREGIFNISYEQLGDKYIFHDYGHGGGGWTLLFGSVNKSLRLLQKVKVDNPSITFDKITVIGAGIIGLQTALCLTELGYSVSIIAKNIDNLTSHNAGGLLAPISMQNDHENKVIADEVAIESFKEWKVIAAGQNKKLKGCAKFMHVYCSEDTDAGLDVYIENNLMPKGQKVQLDFGIESERKIMLEYSTIYINTDFMMQRMHELLIQHNIKIQINNIKSFYDIESRVIFNCSGIGSQVLNNDKSLIPVYGHLLLLANQPQSTKNYMIYTKYLNNYVYYMPKRGGVIGGTYIREDEYKESREYYTNLIQSVASDFFGAKK